MFFCILKEVKGVSPDFTYVSVWELGSLPGVDWVVKKNLSVCQDNRGNFVKCEKKGDWSEVIIEFWVLALFWDKSYESNFLSWWKRMVVEAIIYGKGYKVFN